MTPPVLLILGAYGKTGQLLCPLLLRETEACLMVAGRSAERAGKLADELNRDFPGERVRSMALDASDSDALRAAMESATLVVVATSTTTHTRQIAEAALATETDYLDIQLPTRRKVGVLDELRGRIEAQGRCFITDGGFHPGVPAALMRHLAAQLENVSMVRVGCLIHEDWANIGAQSATMEEFFDEFFHMRSECYREGEWRKASGQDFVRLDFGMSGGPVMCVPLYLPELRSLPEQYPTIRRCSFSMAGSGWFPDFVLYPAAMLADKLGWKGMARRLIGKVLAMSPSEPPGAWLLGEASNDAGTHLRIMLHHVDSYQFTAIPVVACVRQYLSGKRQTGVICQANYVETGAFVADLERMGVAFGAVA